jgi:hypothetical protein
MPNFAAPYQSKFQDGEAEHKGGNLPPVVGFFDGSTRERTLRAPPRSVPEHRHLPQRGDLVLRRCHRHHQLGNHSRCHCRLLLSPSPLTSRIDALLGACFRAESA